MKRVENEWKYNNNVGLDGGRWSWNAYVR